MIRFTDLLQAQSIVHTLCGISIVYLWLKLILSENQFVKPVKAKTHALHCGNLLVVFL